MRRHPNAITAAKLAVAALCMAGLFAAAVLVLLTVAALVLLPLRQFLLRHGATDVQWFWFRSEPPGLAGLREQRRNAGRSR